MTIINIEKKLKELNTPFRIGINKILTLTDMGFDFVDIFYRFNRKRKGMSRRERQEFSSWAWPGKKR